MTTIRRMPMMDLLFILLDRQESPANVGIVMLFEPPPGGTARSVIRRILRIYRAARPVAPFSDLADLVGMSLPRWRECPAIDMRYHVRHETLAAPGDLQTLRERIADLHRRPFDRAHPLFEVRLIDGLENGRFAFYMKSHHALWDGRLALERIFGSLSNEPGPIGTPFYAGEPAVSVPMPDASVAPDLGAGLRGVLGQVGALRELAGAFSTRLAANAPEASPARGNAPFTGPHTLLNAPVTDAGRSIAMFSLPLDAMRRVSRTHGGTLNDVVLAVVDGGVQRYLRRRGERHRDPLVAMCPVSLREPGDLEATTKVATMFVPLARPGAGASRRMQQIVANTSAAKREFRSLSKAAAMDYGFLVLTIWAGARLLGVQDVARPVLNFVVSNVGGSAGPRFLGGSRLVGAYPMSMVGDPTGLNVTTVSSDGRMDFGIVANRAAVPDADEIANACHEAFGELRRSKRRPAGLSSSPAGRTRSAAIPAPAASP